MDVLKKYSEEIERNIKPATFPIAVRMLRNTGELPIEAKRPRRDFGTCLSVCQAFALSRRSGLSIAMLKEDMWCPEPVIGFGLEEPPRFFLDGHNRYPDGVKSLKAGENWAQEFPRFKVGEYVGVVSAPLFKANFKPDIVIIYCNSLQLLRLLLAIAYKDGRDITSRLSGHAACVYSVVPSITTCNCWVSIPCRGDRRIAGAQDNEIIFTIPWSKLDDLVLGFGKKGTGSVPITNTMVTEYKMSPSYAKMARMMGLTKSNGSEIEGFTEKNPYE